MPVFIEYPDRNSQVNIREVVQIERKYNNVVLYMSDGRWITGTYGSDEQAVEGMKEIKQMIRHAMLYSNPFPPGEENKVKTTPEIKYRKLADIPDLEINDKGDWIDLYTAENELLHVGEFKRIPLGVAMELPKGYEAVVVPRSSTFGKYGVVQTNSMGVIDESYKGDGDEWSMPVFATREVYIPSGTRLCQFRIQEHQPPLMFSVVEHLGNADRGGYGTTGD